MLPEENIINDIQATVAKARLAYQASEISGAEERGEAPKLIWQS